jgi:hypothetical protein
MRPPWRDRPRSRESRRATQGLSASGGESRDLINWSPLLPIEDLHGVHESSFARLNYRPPQAHPASPSAVRM